jgi:hypothetical protein
MQTSRVRLMLIALLGVFAFSAVAATAAEAEEAPFWTVPKTEGSKETKRLALNETRYITAKSYKTTSLEGGGVTITCPTVALNEGVLLGSNAGEPGTNDEVIEFSGGCTQTGNTVKGTCTVKEPIVTKPVKSELVESEKGGPTASLLTEFFPNKGALFTTVEFTPSEPGACKVTAIAVEGSVAAEVYTDPNNGSLGELVKLPNTGKQGKSWLLNFPATPIKKVWLIKNKTGAEAGVELKANTEPATFKGTVLVLLANSKHVSVEEEWSPLP